MENLGLDKSGADGLADDGGTRLLQAIRSDFSLVDVFWALYPARRLFTFSAQGVSTRLDRFYVSSTVVGRVKSSSIIPCTITDHSIIETTFDDGLFETYVHGPGYWKLNVSLLNDRELVERVEALWVTLKGSHVKNGMWWENCKLSFKKLLVQYSRKRALKSKKQAQVLLAQVTLLEELAVEDPLFFADLLSSLKESLNSLSASRARGAQVRSRSFYLNTEEKPCSYFLRRELAGSQDKYIAELCDNSGHLFRDSLSLQRVCVDFYKDLLSEYPVDDDVARGFLGSVPALEKVFRLLCEGSLTYEECLRVVKGMKAGKCPGLDGRPSEFYRKIFYLFGLDFVGMVNGCFVRGELPLSLRTGLATLICKDKSKKSSLKYWRPISLLNVHYKIISKSIANRLSKVMHTIVSVDQTCSVPGRSITDNLDLRRTDMQPCLIPLSDFKPIIRKHITAMWQATWDESPLNKLHEIAPIVNEPRTHHLSTRRDQSVFNRCRIGHSRLTHEFLLKGEPPPECIPCNCPLTIKHLLIECVDFNDVRQRFYQVPSLQDLFKTVKPEVILDFLKAAVLYRLL